MFGDDYLDIRRNQSFENDIKNENLKEPTLIIARWEKRSTRGLGYHLGYIQSEIHFNPGIGFEMMQDYSTLGGSIRYGGISPKLSGLYSQFPEVRFMYRTYIDDESLINSTISPGWQFVTKNQWQTELNYVYTADNLRDSLRISSDVYIEPGKYSFSSLRGNVISPMSKSVYTMFMTEMGQYYNGKRISFRLKPTCYISKHSEIAGTYNFDHFSIK